jgi:hypothetical protein
MDALAEDPAAEERRAREAADRVTAKIERQGFGHSRNSRRGVVAGIAWQRPPFFE